MHGLFKVARHGFHSLGQLFAFKHLKCGKPRSTGNRMGRIRVTVRKLDHVIRSALIHVGVVDFLLAHNGAQRLDAVSNLLGER